MVRDLVEFYFVYICCSTMRSGKRLDMMCLFRIQTLIYKLEQKAG